MEPAASPSSQTPLDSDEPLAGETSAVGHEPRAVEQPAVIADPAIADPAIADPVIADPHIGRPDPASAPRRRLARPGRRAFRRIGLALGGGVLVVGLVAGGAALDRTGVLGGPAAEPTPPSAQDFALVREAWDLLHEKYVGAANLDERKLAYGAIEGMTQAVDDPGHTSFETPEELAQAHAALSGSYVGIGVQLDTRDTGPVIVTVFRGGPAAAAGLRPGDRIVAVDGTSTKGLDLDAVAALVRGKEGTKVRITVERDGRDSPIDLTLVRSKIDLPAVDWATVPGSNIAMLRLESFSSGSADEFKAALKDIIATHPKGLVLDLRGNGGGYVNEAIAIASQFLSSGDVHLSRDAQGKITPTAVEPGGLAQDIPLVVLVDEGTASSAEIVTGALQDAHRATIVGRRTFGTGTVLSEVPLEDGSALRIGVIEWLTPSGRSIWREGLAPDVSVTLANATLPLVPADLRSLDAKQIAARDDLQLDKAIELLTTPKPTVADQEPADAPARHLPG